LRISCPGALYDFRIQLIPKFVFRLLRFKFGDDVDDERCARPIGLSIFLDRQSSKDSPTYCAKSLLGTILLFNILDSMDGF